MSSAGVIGVMIHRATVERDTAAGANDWGHPPVPSYEAHLTEQRCYAWEEQSASITDTGKSVILRTVHAVMPIGTEIAEGDRISSITDRAGNRIFAGPLVVTSLARHRTHLELILERAS